MPVAVGHRLTFGNFFLISTGDRPAAIIAIEPFGVEGVAVITLATYVPVKGHVVGTAIDNPFYAPSELTAPDATVIPAHGELQVVVILERTAGASRSYVGGFVVQFRVGTDRYELHSTQTITLTDP